MNGIDQMTRDLSVMSSGATFAAYAHKDWGDNYPVSGDELAKVRAGMELVQEVTDGGPDCGA